MRIVIAGGSGFLGTELSRQLAKDGHAVVVLTRDPEEPREPGLVRYAAWTPDGEARAWAREFEGADAIVNLAGAGIADKRWSAARKRLLRDSRILSTRSIANAIRKMTRRPEVLIQGSAEGYYGAYDNGPVLDESSPPGTDFLGNTCVAWEAEAQPVAALGVRVVFARTCIVISRHGGALPKMALPFKAFVGGPLGSGKQTMPWIHLDDWVAIVAWAIGNSSVSGPINLGSPHPVTNAEFSNAIGRALHRPSFMPVPGFVLRIIVGEMADAALLRGHRLFPTRTMQLGYKFKYERIDDALAAELR